MIDLVIKQLGNFFFLSAAELILLKKIIPSVYIEVEIMMQKINIKYFKSGKFNAFHNGQSTMFYYKLSRHISLLNGFEELADKVYNYVKIISGADLFHGVELPEVYFHEHPVGSVMGRAAYSNYFVFQQNCTVGGNNGIYPKIGEFVWMFANSMILGASDIGSNVFVGAGAIIKDECIPDNSLVFGHSPNLIIKNKDESYFFSRSIFFDHLDKKKL